LCKHLGAADMNPKREILTWMSISFFPSLLIVV